MSKERFEIFGDKLVKDNEQTPNLLNNYLCCVRLNKFADKISDLETKLEESEKERELDNSFWKQECDSLQKALAEKETEIHDFVDELKWARICIKELEYNNQDKISFAVEQLTEIREYVKECWGLDELEGKVRLDIAKKIRLKIEQLKEGK